MNDETEVLEERDFTQDVKVNRFKLEKASEQQAELYRYWSEKEGEAKNEVARKEDHVKYIESKVEMDIRKKALDNKGNLENGVKATADAVKAAILIDKEVRKAKRELLHAKDEWITYRAAKDGMEHRKSSISDLTKQWCAGYYADPNRPKTRNDELGNKARKNLNN